MLNAIRIRLVMPEIELSPLEAVTTGKTENATVAVAELQKWEPLPSHKEETQSVQSFRARRIMFKYVQR